MHKSLNRVLTSIVCILCPSSMPAATVNDANRTASTQFLAKSMGKFIKRQREMLPIRTLEIMDIMDIMDTMDTHITTTRIKNTTSITTTSTNTNHRQWGSRSKYTTSGANMQK